MRFPSRLVDVRIAIANACGRQTDRIARSTGKTELFTSEIAVTLGTVFVGNVVALHTTRPCSETTIEAQNHRRPNVQGRTSTQNMPYLMELIFNYS